MGNIANRQSLVFSEHGRLSQTILQFHVERLLHKRAPIEQCRTDFCVLGGGMTANER